MSNLRIQCRHIIAEYAEQMNLENKKVLDVGIGGDPYPGENFIHFGEKNTYETLDIDPQYNPTFVKDICDTKIKSNSFDLIILSNTIEHIWEYKKAIKELYRLTKRYAIIDSPLSYPYHAEDNFEDYWRFTTRGLEKLAQEVGFVIINKLQTTELSSVLCLKEA